MLRAYATQRGGVFDVDAEYVTRRAELQRRQKTERRVLGRTGLALRLFEQWDTGKEHTRSGSDDHTGVMSLLCSFQGMPRSV